MAVASSVEPARARRLPTSERGARIAIITAATVAAASLRLQFLSHQSLWFDEIYTRAIVSHGSLSGVLAGIHATESTPPLYYVLTWIWTQMAGDSTAMLRIPGAVAGVLCVPATYLALRRLVGVRAAIAAAWLAATSPMLVYYSLDARSYSLLVLLAIVSLWAMGAVLETPTPRWFAAWAVACVALCCTHYFGGFVVAAEIAVLAWQAPKHRRALAAASAGIVVLLLPLLPLFLHQRGAERAAFISRISLTTRIEEAARQLAMGPNVPSAMLECPGLLLAFAGLLAGMLILWRGRGAQSGSDGRQGTLTGAGSRRAIVPLTAVFLLGAAVPLLLAITKIDEAFLARNLLGAWAVLAALAAIGLSRFRATPLAVYCLLCVATVLAIQSNWHYQNVDWRGAIRQFQAQIEDQPVAVYGSQAAPVAALYLRRHATAGPIDTSSLWVLVEPARVGTRALEPVPGTPAPSEPGAPFALAGSFTFQGVRALHFVAPRPTIVTASALGADSIDGSAPTLLAR